MSVVELDRLKRALHPEKAMNVVDQCEIVYKALSVGGVYQGRETALAEYLEISYNKVYKMERAYRCSTPELKEWFRESEYQVNTFYDRAVLPADAQHVFLRDMKILVDGHD